MPPISFSASEVRVAATCPRILYFDAEHTQRHQLKTRAITRIWKEGDAETTACGTIFHGVVERFNRQAAKAPEVRAVLSGAPEPASIQRGLLEFLNGHCIDLDALAARPVPQRQAFIAALHVYMSELADIVADALTRGKPADEILDQMFGDRRRRVDVTFQVGPSGEPVRVTGILDYVFYDWRTAHHRIIDYKLTPAHEPSNDLFQVALYALMHHHQHRTQPDVGVLYLHPERRMAELTWEQVHEKRHRVYDLLASMAAWVHYDESTGKGLKPVGEPASCPYCKWDRKNQCVLRLGPKHEGRRFRHWTDAASAIDKADEPPIAIRAVENEPGTPVAEVPRADALRIGTTVEGGEAVTMPLAALPTHVAVVGAAGSGKTWMAKVIAEEAIRLGVPVLAVDPQGDLVQFLRAAEERPGLSGQEKAIRKEFLDRVVPRVWTPGTSHGLRLSLDPIRLVGRDELVRVAPARREEEWEGMLAVAANHLVGLAKVGGEEDSQRTFVLQVLRALTRDAGKAPVDLSRITDAITDPEAFGLDAPERFIKKGEREKLARKLNGLLHGPAASLYQGGRCLDLDALRCTEGPGKTPLNVIYLNALADDDQKQFFVAALAAEIYRWMVTSLDPTGRPNLLFYLDEARDFIPAGTVKPPAKTPLTRLFTQGRKYGVACLLCTQSPRSVDYNVFGNCSAKLIGRLESAQDQERVADWFATEGPAPPWLSGRKGATAGSFVGRWPQMSPALEGRAIRSRSLFSLHEGAWSPDRLEREMGARRAGRTSSV